MTRRARWLMEPKAAPPHSAAARPRARIAGWFAGIFLVFAVIAPHALADFPFPRPPDVEPNVKFWVDVFTAYSNRDFVIHDRDRIWRVYQVLHIPGEGTPDRSEVDAANDYLKSKFSDILTKLASGQAPADYEQRQGASLF